MNKIIMPLTLGTSDEIKKGIKDIVNQLEKNNYAISLNGKATRLFGKKIPDVYKRKGIVIFSKPSYRYPNGELKSVIVINPKYRILKRGKYKFKILLK